MLPFRDHSASDDRAPGKVPPQLRQQENPPLDFVARYLCLILAGVFFGSYACFFSVARVLRTLPPERFEGGPGFALNAPAMMPGLLALVSFCCAFALLIITHIGRWRSLAKIPNPLTILLLLPGIWVMLKILWLLVLRVVWIFDQLFGGYP